MKPNQILPAMALAFATQSHAVDKNLTQVQEPPSEKVERASTIANMALETKKIFERMMEDLVEQPGYDSCIGSKLEKGKVRQEFTFFDRDKGLFTHKQTFGLAGPNALSCATDVANGINIAFTNNPTLPVACESTIPTAQSPQLELTCFTFITFEDTPSTTDKETPEATNKAE